MNKQGEMYEYLRSRIPAELWEKYSHLSFKDMAEVDELKPWAPELQQASEHWFDEEEKVSRH